MREIDIKRSNMAMAMAMAMAMVMPMAEQNDEQNYKTDKIETKYIRRQRK